MPAPTITTCCGCVVFSNPFLAISRKASYSGYLKHSSSGLELPLPLCSVTHRNNEESTGKETKHKPRSACGAFFTLCGFLLPPSAPFGRTRGTFSFGGPHFVSCSVPQPTWFSVAAHSAMLLLAQQGVWGRPGGLSQVSLDQPSILFAGLRMACPGDQTDQVTSDQFGSGVSQ